MVGLDHCGFTAQAALYHVRVNGALRQEVHGSDLLRLFLEHTDEFLANDLALLLRLLYAGQFAVISLLRVDADKVQVEITFRSEHRFHLVAFIFAEQAVVNEDAGQLLPDCF